jgi:hypothetical protein
MSIQIVLTKKEIAECAAQDAILRKRFPPEVLGHCLGCHAKLLVGYMPVVTKWATEDRGGIPTLVPVEMYCQKCGKGMGLSKHVRRQNAAVSPSQAPHAPAVSPVKELAVKLLRACSEVPHGSKKLAVLAGIEYSDLVLPILKKLRDAGKVEFADGKWTRA